MPSQVARRSARRVRPESDYLRQLTLAYPELAELDRRLQANKARFDMSLVLRDDTAPNVGNALERLDTAFGLAGELLHGRQALGGRARNRPIPQGGLRIREARPGSLIVVLVVYGAAEAWAAAHPIALALMTAAALTAPKQVARISRWSKKGGAKAKSAAKVDKSTEEISISWTKARDGSLKDISVAATSHGKEGIAGDHVVVKVESPSERIEVAFTVDQSARPAKRASISSPALRTQPRRWLL